MATNLKLDDALVVEAVQLSGSKSKREAVTQALEEFVRHRKQRRLFEIEGTVDYDPSYDYKLQRQRP